MERTASRKIKDWATRQHAYTAIMVAEKIADMMQGEDPQRTQRDSAVPSSTARCPLPT